MLKEFYTTKFFKVIIILLFFGFLIIWNPVNFFDGIRSGLFRVIYPFQKILYITSFKVKETKEIIFSIGDLKEENEKLFEKNLKLEAKIAKLEDIKKENDLLRGEIDLLPKKEFNLESTQVIGQNSDLSGHWVMVDKGKQDGIKEGMSVIVSGNNLVGRVDKVFSKTAKINLLTNPSSRINAVVVSTQAKGIIKGEHGLGLILDMVMQTDVLNKGDNVVTSGLGGDMPRGLFIGKIQKIYPSQDHLFQQAMITNPIKFNKLRYVFIIKDF